MRKEGEKEQQAEGVIKEQKKKAAPTRSAGLTASWADETEGEYPEK